MQEPLVIKLNEVRSQETFESSIVLARLNGVQIRFAPTHPMDLAKDIRFCLLALRFVGCGS